MSKKKSLASQKIRHLNLVNTHYKKMLESLNQELEEEGAFSMNIILGELSKILTEDFAYTIVDDCIKCMMSPEKIQTIVNRIVKGTGMSIEKGTIRAFNAHGIKANIQSVETEIKKND